MPTGEEKRVPVDSENIRPRLYALPGAQRATSRRRRPARASTRRPSIGADGSLKVGSKVIAGTVLARIGEGADGVDPHINFSIRPAGRGAPRIDPKPILDGWKLLEATAIYRAKGKSPFAAKLSGAGVLLLSKEALQRAGPRRQAASKSPTATAIEIRAGQIDRRLLATLAYLSEQGFRPDDHLAALRPHGSITTSGNVSNHSFGNAVDIAVINGIPVLGHQGPGSITEELLRDGAAPAGHDDPRRADLAAGTAAGRASRWATTPTTSTSATARWAAPTTAQLRAAAQTEPVAAPDRPPRRDREPRGADRALRRLAARQAAKPASAGGAKVAGPAAPKAATDPLRGESGPLTQLFGFAQFDFAGTLARRRRPLPGARRGGRRAERAGHRDARRRAPLPGRRRRRPQPAEAGRPPPELPLSRATAVRAAEPFAERGGGRALAARRRSSPRRPSTPSSSEGIACVNRALLRPGGGRPPTRTSRELAPSSTAIAVRIGYGSGEEVAAGRYTARPLGRRRGDRRLAPAAARRGAAPAGAGRRRARRPRTDRRLRDAAAARPRRPRRRARRARRPCSCGSGSRRCWSSSTARSPTPATRRTWPSSRRGAARSGEAANAALRGDLERASASAGRAS